MRGIFLLLVLLLACCKQEAAPQLRVQPLGCAIYWERGPRPLCATLPEPGKGELLRIAISGPALSTVQVAVDGVSRFSGKVPMAGRLVVDLPAESTEGLLKVTLGEGRQSSRSLEVVRSHPFPKARAIRMRIEQMDRSAWIAQVRAALAEADQPTSQLGEAERAFLFGQMGQLMYQLVRKKDSDEHVPPESLNFAIEILNRSLREAHRVRIYSDEVVSLRRLGILLTQGESPNTQQALAVLRELAHPDVLDRYPEESAELYYKLSWLYEEAGDLHAALDAIHRAITMAEEVGLDVSDSTRFALQRANILQYLNRTRESRRIGQEILRTLRADKITEPCDLLKQYNTLGWIHVLALQSGDRAATPRPLLEQAASQVARCAESSRETAQYDGGLVLLNLARAELLAAEQAADGSPERERMLTEAEQHHRAAGALKGLRLDFYLDVHELAGRMALLRKQGDAALAAFQQLTQLTAAVILTPYFRWVALVGEADALALLGRTAESLERYAQAERLLARVANGLPLSARRQMFMAQFEQGTARYLELLAADPARTGQVLAVMRDARTRALRSYVRPFTESADQGIRRAQLAPYYELHAQRDEAAHKLHDAPLVERSKAQARLEQIEQQLRSVVEELYQGQAGAPDTPRFRSPLPDELLVTCHPRPRSSGGEPWLCAAADSQGIYLHRIAAPALHENADEATPAELAAKIASDQAMATELVRVLAAPLARARRLHILPYGAMRDIAWEQVPSSGKPLGELVTVTYGTDMSGELRPQSARQALVVLDPEQDLVGAHRSASRILPELQARGWATEPYQGAPPHGRHLFGSLRERWRKPKVSPAIAREILPRLPSAGLFIYYGHAQGSTYSGWDSSLRFADGGTIAARDIMALPVVPRQVLLIGCETAITDRGAPADQIGLAQAFLLRGSEEVLATTRKVPDVQAERLVAELVTRGAFAAEAPPLSESVRGALNALQKREPHPDWAAFRVYRP